MWIIIGIIWASGIGAIIWGINKIVRTIHNRIDEIEESLGLTLRNMEINLDLLYGKLADQVDEKNKVIEVKSTLEDIHKLGLLLTSIPKSRKKIKVTLDLPNGKFIKFIISK